MKYGYKLEWNINFVALLGKCPAMVAMVCKILTNYVHQCLKTTIVLRTGLGQKQVREEQSCTQIGSCVLISWDGDQ